MITYLRAHTIAKLQCLLKLKRQFLAKHLHGNNSICYSGVLDFSAFIVCYTDIFSTRFGFRLLPFMRMEFFGRMMMNVCLLQMPLGWSPWQPGALMLKADNFEAHLNRDITSASRVLQGFCLFFFNPLVSFLCFGFLFCPVPLT